MIYPIDPVAKPRMTQRDKWKKSPAVKKYMEFKDLCRLYKVGLPESGARIRFVIAMPRSWSKKKREAMDGQPHTQKPDLDNLLKALLDSVYRDDAKVWNIAGLQKVWGYTGLIIITRY